MSGEPLGVPGAGPRPVAARLDAVFPQQQQALSHGRNEVDLGRVARALWRRAGLILAVTLAFTVAGAGAAHFARPRYTAELELVLTVRGATDGPVGTMEGGIGNGDTEEVASAIDTLTSPYTIRQVVNEYRLQDDPEFNTALAPPGPIQRLLGWLRGTGASAPAPPPSAEEGRAIAEANLRSRLSVTNDGRSYTIDVTFTSVDPDKAAHIANAIAKTYLAEDLDGRAAELDRMSGLLDHRSDALRQRLIDTKAAVDAYKAKHGILDLGSDQTLLSDTIAKFDSEMVSAEADRAQAESELSQLEEFARTRNPETAAKAAGASENLKMLIDRRNKAASDLAGVGAMWGPRNPWSIEMERGVTRIDEEIAGETQQSMAVLKARVNVAKAREQAIKGNLDRLVASNQESMKAGAGLRRLEADADTAHALYQTFLATAGQANVESSALAGNARIVSPASPPVFPSYPLRFLALAVSGFAGLVSGLALALGLEAARRTLCTPEEVAERLGLATLGLTPHIGRRASRAHGAVAMSIAAVDDPLGTVAEAIRSIGTGLARGAEAARVILVTSALPGEGKTSLALSFGRLAASSGRRVLLVECDLRSARLSAVLGRCSGPGLGEVLEGSGDFSKAINVDEASGMHFLSSGCKVAFPAERLGSPRMRRFIGLARQYYELVILDTPPAGIVVDALQLACVVDIALLVVQWGRTSYRAVSHTLERLEIAGAPAVGVVLSHVRVKKLKSYGTVYAPAETGYLSGQK
jgi:polysaccharide biosynthesis transport protein